MRDETAETGANMGGAGAGTPATDSRTTTMPRTTRPARRTVPGSPPARSPVHGDGAGPGAESADERGLQGAFLAHGGELYGYARRSLGDAGAAEDVVQETFVRAWRARDRFDANLGTLRTWLFTIARRVVIDHARSRAVRQADPLPADLAVADDEMERAMMGWQVEEAIRRLRPEHREVLVETYYRGRSGRDVAETLGIPEGTVRSRLFYALRTLRLTLDEMGWER